MSKPVVYWTHGDLMWLSKIVRNFDNYRNHFDALVNSLLEDENLGFDVEPHNQEADLYAFFVYFKRGGKNDVLIRSNEDWSVVPFKNYVCRTYETEHREMVHLLEEVKDTYFIRCLFQEFMYKCVEKKYDFVDCPGVITHEN